MGHKSGFKFKVSSFNIEATIVGLLLLFLFTSCENGFHSVAAPKGYKKYSFYKQPRIRKHAIRIGNSILVRDRGGYDTGASGAMK